MIYTTKQNKKQNLKKFIKAICVATFWILIWEAASRVVSRNNELLLLILPGPFTVLKRWTQIAFTPAFIKAEALTLLRIFTGFFIGCLAGFFMGIATHTSKLIYSLLSPILKIIRAVPVVAIIILMYLFFNSSTLPILIVCLMVMPIVWQSVNDGLNNTDKSIGEMAKVYNLSKLTVFTNIKLPNIAPRLITACVNALGLAWKSGVAAEVICLPDISLGTMLWQGKGNVNYDDVYAVTLTVVLLSLGIEYLLKFLYKKYLLKDRCASDD